MKLHKCKFEALTIHLIQYIKKINIFLFIYFRLIDRINKSALELKEKADDNVINFVRKIINNEKVLKDTLSQIQYDINLIETVVGGNKDNDFIKLSKYVKMKLFVLLTITIY